jgi:hypothetical protein
MRRIRPVIACVVMIIHFASPRANAQQDSRQQADPDDQSSVTERILTADDLASATGGAGTLPLRIVGWPYRRLMASMERGLVAFERHKIRERISDFQARLNARGVGLLFGGLGEGSGIGLGIVQEAPPRPAARAREYLKEQRQAGLRLMARQSFSGYQELAAGFESAPVPRSTFVLETDYQWRPNESFYGLGQQSRRENHSSFALRQWSGGMLWETRPIRHLRAGTEYKVAALTTGPSLSGRFPSIETVFGDELAGFNERVELQSIGGFFDADLMQGDYKLGGRVHIGASWQDSFGAAEIRYARYEGRFDGRLPIVRGRSALVGQIAAEFTREAPGSQPVPFFLYPRVGGSSTLRGFALDRFYGRNMIFMTLEYRWALHPNFEAQLIHDAGQIFDRSEEFGFFDWHRNYGFGIRFRTEGGTQFRIEVASSVEGFSVHVSFGDRVPRPLGGPVRYPLYRP